MLVKFLNAGDHLKHLQETFDILREHNMKLNAEKCAFGVSSGKFLGFLVSQRGIEVYGIFDTKEEHMQQYVVKVQAVLARFREWSITHIPREDNAEADALANLGSSTKIQGSESETVEQLMNSAMDTNGYYEVNSTSLVWDWRNEIIDYLEHGKLPEDPKTSRALRAKAAHYSLKKGKLYGKSFQGPLTRCLGASEDNYVMREDHKGICGNHSGADSLVLKLARLGYYWPRVEQDAKDFVRKYDNCQRYAPLVHQSAEPLHSVLSS
ncbi:uncharacterized protein [Nicotiana tomentosiformis]|uniref:uncharacterized protein n=1 Tax=Nicotiana tomentosiformis TaxID=4098 RepID=UPI00388CCC77